MTVVAPLVLVLLVPGPRAGGQELGGTPEADGPDVTFTVTEAATTAQMITVPLNQGVLVDFSVPVREVRVANPSIADVTATSPRQILVDGKSYGTTQLVVLVDGGVQRMFTVAVDLDLARLQAAVERAVPRARVKASGMLDTVVLTGTVPDVESAEHIMQIAGIYSKDVVNHMRVAGVHQVLLRCTVAEVNRSATRRLGFNGWLAGSGVPDMFTVSQIAGINPVDISAVSGASVQSQIPFQTNEMGLSQAPTLSFGFPRVEMQIFIQALRENGHLQVLAEPNLVTISGESASFLAGGEFPIPVAQRDSVTVEFREFGVRLSFTPTVLSQDVIRLRVAPEVSEPDYTNAVTISGFVVPGLTSRKVETVVELGEGQTFAIGGLLSERTRAVVSKVPALGDLPVLGALFSSTEYQSNESELVVLVTPELVAPLNPDQVHYVPGTDYIPPNDWELFLLGQIEGEGDPNKTPGDGTPQAANESVDGRPAAAMRLRGPMGPAGVGEGV
jgi:pilus assembly protein CpaC